MDLARADLALRDEVLMTTFHSILCATSGVLRVPSAFRTIWVERCMDAEDVDFRSE